MISFEKKRSKFDCNNREIKINDSSIPVKFYYEYSKFNKIKLCEKNTINENENRKREFYTKPRSEILIEIDIMNLKIKENTLPTDGTGKNFFLL